MYLFLLLLCSFVSFIQCISIYEIFLLNILVVLCIIKKFLSVFNLFKTENKLNNKNKIIYYRTVVIRFLIITILHLIEYASLFHFDVLVINLVCSFLYITKWKMYIVIAQKNRFFLCYYVFRMLHILKLTENVFSGKRAHHVLCQQRLCVNFFKF